MVLEIRDIKTYVRNDIGLLEVRNEAIKAVVRESRPRCWICLSGAISDAARRGQPFCERGDNGLEARKHELPEALREYGWRTLRGVIHELLEAKRVFKCVAKGQKSKKYLDVPAGPLPWAWVKLSLEPAMICKFRPCTAPCTGAASYFNVLFVLCTAFIFFVYRCLKASNTCTTKSNTGTREGSKTRKALWA